MTRQYVEGTGPWCNECGFTQGQGPKSCSACRGMEPDMSVIRQGLEAAKDLTRMVVRCSVPDCLVCRHNNRLREQLDAAITEATKGD